MRVKINEIVYFTSATFCAIGLIAIPLTALAPFSLPIGIAYGATLLTSAIISYVALSKLSSYNWDAAIKDTPEEKAQLFKMRQLNYVVACDAWNAPTNQTIRYSNGAIVQLSSSYSKKHNFQQADTKKYSQKVWDNGEYSRWVHLELLKEPKA